MSLRIDLDKYVITSTSRAFILNKKTILKSGKNIGQESLSPIGHYRHLDQMGRDLSRLKINSADIKGIKQLGEKIDLIALNFAEALSNLSSELHKYQLREREHSVTND
ncbi:hypothetical protein ABLB84_06160 [Xenorhabdus szentirmaii]|uniref:hypothetical protein n=1 Tax=Xenorhabdus szentirmaii TaxID=290112 RepID=UPI0032B823CE